VEVKLETTGAGGEEAGGVRDASVIEMPGAAETISGPGAPRPFGQRKRAGGQLGSRPPAR